MVGYVGPPLRPAELVLKPAHSLYVQSYRPREMTSGVVNADGWGAALWLGDGRVDPALYRSAQPIWADPNLPFVCERTQATAALLAVRSATPGIPYELACVQPFSRGPISFLHNGFITGWQRGPARLLREGLGDTAYQAVQGGPDGKWDKELEELTANDLLDMIEHQAKQGVDYMTLHVSDGETMVGARHASGLAPATLYYAGGPSSARELGWCMASEPLWGEGQGSTSFREIPAGHLAVARKGHDVRVEALA